METMRAFIAVDIGDGIRANLDALGRKFKKVHANVRWVKPQAIHLTLAFLGDVPADRIEPLKAALALACRDVAAFALEAQGCGTFGRPNHPRVVWAGIADCPSLARLQGRIAQRLRDAGFEVDGKPFSPHLTLGRVKETDRHTAPLLEKIEKAKALPLGATRIESVELIHSRLTPRGAEYTVLHRVGLQEGSG